MSVERWAVFAGLYAGIAFGVFWIPLRALEDSGFVGPWSMVLFAGLPVLFCLPFVWKYRAVYAENSLWALSGGIVGGIAFALYATAFLYTDVVRVVVLFYAMPAWGFLLAWIFLKDPITPARMGTLGLCFAGLYVVFGQHTGLPIPQNLGDWCALISGFVWAAAALLILMQQKIGYVVHGINFFASSAIACLIVSLLVTAQGMLTAPTMDQLWDALSWVLPITFVLTIPACLAAVFAPGHLNPGVAGLLFTTEVVVGAITAAIWADEVLGAREIIGLILIISAGLVEPAMMFLKRETKA
ncbi:MAG: DMT family transporter [Pseudomonadota bacterium]